MPLAAIATTPAALNRLSPLIQSLKNSGEAAVLWIPEALALASAANSAEHIQPYGGPLKTHIAHLWPSHRALIFGLATGATTRLIAPLLQDKATDPAIIVVDEAGQFVISLCGGHQGGADRLAQIIATQLEAQAVLTGAANHHDLPGIDIVGKPFGWTQGSGDWTGVSAAVARSETVEVIQEVGSKLWQRYLPPQQPFRFGFAEPSDAKPAARLWISTAQRQLDGGSLPKAQWHPRVLWVGVGCERGSSRRLIETAIARTFQAAHLAEGAIAGVASLDLKADEAGLVELCQARGWPLRCFSADTLKEIEVPTPSEVVKAEVGTPSVAEAAAIVAAQNVSAQNAASGENSPEKQTLLVKKQIHRLDPEPGAVTVAVAASAIEFTGRTGHLSLVGIGPGALDQMTPAAKGAIAAADAVVGYGLYVDLIKPLLRPGQIVEALPITQERQRAERAIALAHWGLSVAVISSGDSGIYGMAGLVMESLSQSGWDGTTPSVQVFPGITALQAAAARVGTPLMHDFCAISLSDLLTPWEVIQKRLEAAAQGDFVVALYNPKSKTRTEQLAIAQATFLHHRNPSTPVALVRSAYRDREAIQLTTLAELGEAQVDMLTTVLIGNASTLRHGDWMITPRGYLGQA